MTPNTLFDVASLTKVIGTTTIILKLVEKKHLQLEDTLHQHLPEFQDKHVTIRELLTHSSDINGFIPNRSNLNKTELRAALLALKSGAERGKSVVYTDTGTLLLGFLIEKMYHSPVQAVITKEVLEPLNMLSSSFNPSLNNIAATENHPQRGLIIGSVHDPKAHVLGEICGSAGLFTNLADCLTFVSMILSGGHNYLGDSFLKADTIAALFCDQTPTGKDQRSLGWDLKYSRQGEPLLFHTGYTGTFILLSLKKEEAFIFLSNRVHPVDRRDHYLAKRDELLEIYLDEYSERD